MNKTIKSNETHITIGGFFSYHSKQKEVSVIDSSEKDKASNSRDSNGLSTMNLLKLGTWIQVLFKCLIEPLLGYIKEIIDTFSI